MYYLRQAQQSQGQLQRKTAQVHKENIKANKKNAQKRDNKKNPHI